MLQPNTTILAVASERNAARNGLTAAVAAARLKREGPNELPREGKRGLWHIVLEVVSEPMLLMLLAAGLIYLLLGDLGEALLVVALASASIGITIVQEARSERVLEALRDLTSPRALVIRNGERARVPGREVVRGDVLILVEGDRIAADAELLSSHELEIDESLLTGESVAVRKRVASQPASPSPPGGDDLPFVYSGTLVVRGEGLALVTATGARTELGKIGKAIAGIENEPPPIQQETRRLVRLFAAAGVTVSVAVTLLYGWMLRDWLDALLAGIALSMALLPEEFPVILTVFLVMGAWRIARADVLTRRSSAIETLGAATVLCTDKTGTLTENRMTIAAVCDAGQIFENSAATDLSAPEAKRLVAIGRRASQLEPFDPMEKAFHQYADGRLAKDDPLHAEDLVHRYPLASDLLAMSNVWRRPDGSLLVAAKGAPEAVAELCRLDPERRASLAAAVDQMADQGMRVIAVAHAFASSRPPASQRDLPFEFAGLVGLADPLRANVPRSVQDCRSAGIRVIMITGDYPTTARAIARRAGIEAERVVSGPELAKTTDSESAETLRSVSVFARIKPNQKMQLVEGLKRAGEIVAMTGDGVNDAPSLKAAHIGIAMGGRGTDVAREASAIVLLKDDFGSIIETIRLGRRIYDNLRKAMGFVMAAHVPIAGLALLPLIFGGPLILTPVHIAFLEMVIDPICSVAFESETEERDVMARPPRDPKSPLFSLPLILWSALQGTIVLLAVAAVFVMGLRYGMPEAELRSLAFVALVTGNIALVLAGRSFSTSLLRAFSRPNPTLWIVLAIDLALLALVLGWTPLRDLFRFGPIHLHDVFLVVVIGLAMLAILEFAKRYFARHLRA